MRREPSSRVVLRLPNGDRFGLDHGDDLLEGLRATRWFRDRMLDQHVSQPPLAPGGRAHLVELTLEVGEPIRVKEVLQAADGAETRGRSARALTAAMRETFEDGIERGMQGV